MKKAAPKKTQRCPRCGVNGFLNLKAHRCRGAASGREVVPVKRVAVELVAEPNESLTEIEAQLTPIAERIQKKSEDLLYDMVGAGLWLMKAQEAHRLSNVGHAADGKFDGSAGDTGFKGWLETHYPKISRATAYNYINGAKNCGLTVTSGPDAVDTLRARKFLAGKTARDICSLKDKPEVDGDHSGQETRYDLVRDELVSLRERCENVINLRESMTKEAYSTACARLQRTLEEMTQTGWTMSSDRKPGEQLHFKEHGDVYEIGS